MRVQFDQIGQMIRKYEVLRDHTQWILIPSLNDSGVLKIMPCFKMSDYFLDAFRGKTNRIKKVTLATNPMKLSFRGKEIVICRYNYFKKIKRNHLEPLQVQQDKQA